MVNKITTPPTTSELIGTVNEIIDGKQDTLVSGTNIKTINNTSILGSGNITIQSAPDIDNKSITTNSSDELQTVGVIDASNNSTSIKTWTGTKAQYNALATKDSNTIYNVTDDYTGNAVAIVQESGDSASDVMSQKATTDYAGRQLAYPPTGVFTNGNIVVQESIDEFTQNSLFCASYIIKKIYESGNFHGTSTFLGFYKDNNNYITIMRQGYHIYLRQAINGTIVNEQEYLRYVDNLNIGISVYFSIDLVRKKIDIKCANTDGTITDLIAFDFSSWDISTLDTFKIRTSTSGYSVLQSNCYLTVNNYVDYPQLMNYKLSYGRYNVFPIVYRSNASAMATSLMLGGTVIETISPTHKISTVNRTDPSPSSYFALGAIYPDYNNLTGTYLLSRFKITNNDTSNPAVFGPGAISRGYFYNENGELVGDTRLGTFTPTENTWYYIISLAGDKNSDYASRYNLMATGIFTIEAEALWVGYPKNCNMCAETYNGLYFKGSVPMKGQGCEFDNTEHINGNVIPLYQQRIDANGNILMWNGKVWKRLNN